MDKPANQSVNCADTATKNRSVVMDEVNFKYLKHVILKFLTSREVSQSNFTPKFRVDWIHFYVRLKHVIWSERSERCFIWVKTRKNCYTIRLASEWVGLVHDRSRGYTISSKKASLKMTVMNDELSDDNNFFQINGNDDDALWRPKCFFCFKSEKFSSFFRLLFIFALFRCCSTFYLLHCSF